MPLTSEQLQRLRTRHPTLSVEPSCTLVNAHVGTNVALGDGASVQWSLLADDVTVGTHASIVGTRVGAQTRIGDHCTIGNTAHWTTPRQGVETTIGQNVTIGARVTVEAGAFIADGTTIPAGAHVPAAPTASRPSPTLYSEILEQLPLVQVHKLWLADRGDETLRLDYPLQPADIVIDAGGYLGDWAVQIAERSHPQLHIFEPIAHFAQAIRERLGTRARVHPFGLAATTRDENISLEAEGSSIIKDAPASRHERIHLVAAAEIFRDIIPAGTDIALMKINIEGCEYELLEHLIDTGWIGRIHQIQVQFHDFVPNARARRHAIQERLRSTHVQRWNYPFIWEAWERLAPATPGR